MLDFKIDDSTHEGEAIVLTFLDDDNRVRAGGYDVVLTVADAYELQKALRHAIGDYTLKMLDSFKKSY